MRTLKMLLTAALLTCAAAAETHSIASAQVIGCQCILQVWINNVGWVNIVQCVAICPSACCGCGVTSSACVCCPPGTYCSAGQRWGQGYAVCFYVPV